MEFEPRELRDDRAHEANSTGIVKSPNPEMERGTGDAGRAEHLAY